MGLRLNAFATIKEANDKGNYTDCKITISRKDKKRNNVWCTAFVGYATFVGRAHLLRPMKDQRIKILDFEVTNGYLDRNGEQKWNDKCKVAIFDYELQDTSNYSNQTNSNGFNVPNFSQSTVSFEDIGNSDLPF
jgi:hypothetical protein